MRRQITFSITLLLSLTVGYASYGSDLIRFYVEVPIVEIPVFNKNGRNAKLDKLLVDVRTGSDIPEADYAIITKQRRGLYMVEIKDVDVSRITEVIIKMRSPLFAVQELDKDHLLSNMDTTYLLSLDSGKLRKMEVTTQGWEIKGEPVKLDVAFFNGGRPTYIKTLEHSKAEFLFDMNIRRTLSIGLVRHSNPKLKTESIKLRNIRMSECFLRSCEAQSLNQSNPNCPPYKQSRPDSEPHSFVYYKVSLLNEVNQCLNEVNQ